MSTRQLELWTGLAEYPKLILRRYVQELRPFVGDDIVSYWVRDRYVVYSPGEFWPILAYDASVGQWFENKSRRSVVTDVIQARVHPQYETVPLTLGEMKYLVEYGYSALVSQRLTGEIAPIATDMLPSYMRRR